MAVTDEQALKLFNDIKDVCLDIIKDAHEFIKTHDFGKIHIIRINTLDCLLIFL